MESRRTGLRLCFALVLGCANGYAQTAEVIIYSHGSWASEIKPITQNGIFKGGIWDGKEPIAMFTDRLYLTNDRFVVLDLAAGVHVFGTGEGNKPRGKSLLTLDIKAGQRYYLRVYQTSNPLRESSGFEPVSCEQAREDLKAGKALDERAVRKDKRNLLSPKQEIPVCAASVP